jgi:hypothetical protein
LRRESDKIYKPHIREMWAGVARIEACGCMR